MPAYIIQDAYSGYIWGDTRDIDGESKTFQNIVDACQGLDLAVGCDEGRTYQQVPRLRSNDGYIVYRVDIDGSEAVPVVMDGQDQETIEAVARDCQLVGYVEWRNDEVAA